VIPFNPDEVWGVKHRHYVSGSINDCKIRGYLDSDREAFFLPLGAAWRRDNGVEAGASVKVVLAPEGPQSDSLSLDVAAALDAEPQAKTFFDSLATFYRKNYCSFKVGLTGAKIGVPNLFGVFSLNKLRTPHPSNRP
jgi:hypothetical protein